jgi:hypothetical protein
MQFQGLFENIVEFEARYDPPSVGSQATVAEDITIPSARLGDFVLLSIDADLQELVLTGNVVSANTVRIVLVNTLPGAIDLGIVNLHVVVLQPTHDH